MSQQATKSELFDDEQEDDNAAALQRTVRLERLLDKLRGDWLPCFPPSFQSRLGHALEGTLTVHCHRELVDADALRYLAAHYHVKQFNEPLALDYKSFLWAYQSQSQERLLQILNTEYDGKMDWSEARKCGIFLWLRSHDGVRDQAEKVARQQFSGQEERDPTSCSLLYFALGKQKLVWNLWRQSFWHGDQQKMLNFLSNDFTLPRWQSAALKNAFALLSQRRFGKSMLFPVLYEQIGSSVRVVLNQRWPPVSSY